MTRKFFANCILLTLCARETLLGAEANPECSIKTVGDLLEQTRTDVSNSLWGAAGVVVGLAAAEKFNSRLIISVAVPALKQASDYFAAQNLRSQLSNFSSDKRVKVCRASAANSLLPGWAIAGLGLKDVTLLITEPTVNVPRLKYELPPTSLGTGILGAGFDSQFLQELSKQGSAFKLRETAIATQGSAPSGFGALNSAPPQIPQIPNRNRFSELLRTYTPDSLALTTIRGQVYDGRSGRPLPDATVQLARVDQPGTWFGAATSRSGEFTFAVAASGNYQLSAFAPGFYGSSLYIGANASNASGYRVEMQRRSPYPCTFTAENRTPWVVDWRVKSPTWQQMDSFRTIKIEIQGPGDFQAMATFRDAPPVYWNPVPVDCDGPGYTTLVPPQSYTGPR